VQYGYFVTDISRLDIREDKMIVPWCRLQASSYCSQGVVDYKINEAGVSIAH